MKKPLGSWFWICCVSVDKSCNIKTYDRIASAVDKIKIET